MFFGFTDDAIDTYRKWLVWFGFGLVWPSLKEPREVRLRRRGRGSGSRSGSWTSHFDLVSKAMKHVDGGRKQSQATTIVATGVDS